MEDQIEMDIQFDVDVSMCEDLASSSLGETSTENQCIFCYGTVSSSSKKKQKLHALSSDGLQTIIDKCTELRDERLLSYLHENLHLRHSVHNSCRIIYCRKQVGQFADQNLDILNVPTKRKLRSESQTFSWKDMCFLCEQPVDETDSQFRKSETQDLKNNIKDICAKRGYDAWAMQVAGLLESCTDLPSVDAVYHKGCHTRFVNCRTKRPGVAGFGRPCSYGEQLAFNRLCDALETSCVEKVYTLPQLHTEMISLAGPSGDVYSMTQLKRKLEERYGSDLFVAGQPGRPGVVCFKSFTTHVLSDKWYADRDDMGADEQEKVIKKAARLIAAELRATDFDTESYPNAVEIERSSDVVPPLLMLFVGQLVHDSLKSTAIAQALIQAAKPRSCIMPLLFGLGVQIHRQHGSAQLVRQLAKLGFSVSLDEVTRYLQSVMQCTDGWQAAECREAVFTQFVADNVDHNVRTVDGQNTFHGMGIIAACCFGPGVSAVHGRKIQHSKSHLLVS